MENMTRNMLTEAMVETNVRQDRFGVPNKKRKMQDLTKMLDEKTKASGNRKEEGKKEEKEIDEGFDFLEEDLDNLSI